MNCLFIKKTCIKCSVPEKKRIIENIFIFGVNYSLKWKEWENIMYRVSRWNKRKWVVVKDKLCRMGCEKVENDWTKMNRKEKLRKKSQCLHFCCIMPSSTQLWCAHFSVVFPRRKKLTAAPAERQMDSDHCVTQLLSYISSISSFWSNYDFPLH